MPKITQSIVSYPDRGPWGDWKFRGNCSGHLVMDLIHTYQPSLVYDPMAGSGTTADVCAEMQMPCVATDIRTGHNLLFMGARHKIEEMFFVQLGKQPDMIFWHPPYWNMISYVDDYDDLSQSSDYQSYLDRMDSILRWLAKILRPGGFIALLLSDLRLKSSQHTYFLTDDVTNRTAMTRAGLVKEARIIKIQHKTESGGDTGYVIPFVHEYVTILRKPEQ